MKKKIKSKMNQVKFELFITDTKGETRKMPIYNSRNWADLVNDIVLMGCDMENEFLKSLTYDLKKTLSKLCFNPLTGELHEK